MTSDHSEQNWGIHLKMYTINLAMSKGFNLLQMINWWHYCLTWLPLSYDQLMTLFSHLAPTVISSTDDTIFLPGSHYHKINWWYYFLTWLPLSYHQLMTLLSYLAPTIIWSPSCNNSLKSSGCVVLPGKLLIWDIQCWSANTNKQSWATDPSKHTSSW